MKILVADDEPTVRRIMQSFLEKNRHEVVIAEGGRQAFELLKAEGAPHVAIIDWMMPDLTGPEVCAKLRQTKLRIRPYLLMLTSKNGEADLAAGLDAGADDFLTKPFRSAEMLARLRVAERSIGCALEIQERLEEFEALVEHHKMLGEMAARPAVETPAPAAPPAPPVPPPPEPAEPEAGLGLSGDEVAFRAVHALRELGLDAAATRRTSEPRRPYRISYSAWVGFVLPDRECWVDLLLEADPLSVNTIFAQALQRPASPAAGQVFIVEALTIIGSSLRAMLQGRGGEPLAAYLAHGQRVDRTYQELPVGEGATTYFFEVAGAEIALTVCTQPCPVSPVATQALRKADLLAECYPPPGCSEVALFTRGTVLNEHYIGKLTAFGETNKECPPLQIYKPTPLARFFLAKPGAR
jgi:CheY-like chemotaxis protein